MTLQEIKDQIKYLAPERQEWLVDQIYLKKGVARILHKHYNRPLCKFMEECLAGHNPRCRPPVNPSHCNGPVIITEN